MGLELPQALRTDQLEPGNTVRNATPVELLESRQLIGRGRDDHLAAPLVRDAVLVAVCGQRRRALDAQPRLERPGSVVDAGMDDAAVATCLMPRDLPLLVEHDEP